MIYGFFGDLSLILEINSYTFLYFIIYYVFENERYSFNLLSYYVTFFSSEQCNNILGGKFFHPITISREGTHAYTFYCHTNNVHSTVYLFFVNFRIPQTTVNLLTICYNHV